MLSHAYGAAIDNPDLRRRRVVGDGEAETGPLAASLARATSSSTRSRDGAVLPILHLNGYKIANPTVLARIPHDELDALLRGYGHGPLIVEGDEPEAVHRQLAAALDEALDGRSGASRPRAREDGARPAWPMIVLRTPKGWTGPEWSTGCRSRAPGAPTRCRSPRPARTPSTCAQLEEWLRSYRPEELFDATGAPRPEVARARARPATAG